MVQGPGAKELWTRYHGPWIMDQGLVMSGSRTRNVLTKDQVPSIRYQKSMVQGLGAEELWTRDQVPWMINQGPGMYGPETRDQVPGKYEPRNRYQGIMDQGPGTRDQGPKSRNRQGQVSLNLDRLYVLERERTDGRTLFVLLRTFFNCTVLKTQMSQQKYLSSRCLRMCLLRSTSDDLSAPQTAQLTLVSGALPLA